jgi:hypothetical protein
MSQVQHPFSPTPIFIGFGFSGAYGVIAALGIWRTASPDEALEFAASYYTTFNSAISGGLIFSVAFMIYLSQEYVPSIIESSLSCTEESHKDYFSSKEQYSNYRKSFKFSLTFALIGSGIFAAAGFSKHFLPNALMILAGALQYAAGVYIGRKLFHITQMVQSLEATRKPAAMPSLDRLSGILPVVNYISILTAISVCVGVVSYYKASSGHPDEVGQIAHTFMLFPAVIAIPVLLFAIYPRSIVRQLYEVAIDETLGRFRSKAANEKLSQVESQAKLIELRKTLREEVDQQLKYSIEDMPLVLILGIAIISVIKG